MPEQIRNTISLVKFFEKACVGSGWFEMVKDGRNPHSGGMEQASDPSFYVRKYRMKLDGEYVNTWIKFVYNHRDGWADFSMSYHDLDTFNRVMKLADMQEENRSGMARQA